MKYFKTLSIMLMISFTIGLSGCQSATPISSSPNTDTTGVTANTQASLDGFSSKDLIYFVMTDRFKDGNLENNQFPDVNKKDPKSYHGGDFVGITESLDYIQSLGATAIWITPVLKNETKGYHGYWAVDFEAIDPHLGTEAELKALVDEAHKHGIKIVLDYVVNHTGYQSPWLTDKSKAGWFHPKKDISNWSDLKEVENNWLFGLPDLNTENPEVAQYLTENAKSWIRKTGIDGMRLDTVRHVPRPFWADFTKSVKAEFPDFYFLGEVWNDSTRYIQLYNDEGIDGMTNYSLYKGITGTFTRTGSSSAMANALAKEKFFKEPGLNGIFIDNHDNPRFVTVNGKASTKQALSFIMTYPSIPLIYYGTEIGMEGKGDPDNRRDMAWDQTSNNPMLTYYKKLAALRKEIPAITEGVVTIVPSSKDALIYEVTKDNQGILVVMNLRNKPLEEAVTLAAEVSIKGKPSLLISEGDGSLDISSKALKLKLSANQIVVYKIVN